MILDNLVARILVIISKEKFSKFIGRKSAKVVGEGFFCIKERK